MDPYTPTLRALERGPSRAGLYKDTLTDHTRNDHSPWTPDGLVQHTSQSKFREMGHLAKWTSEDG